MSSGLTEEQKRKIEVNRQKAVAKRAERLAAQQTGAAKKGPGLWSPVSCQGSLQQPSKRENHNFNLGSHDFKESSSHGMPQSLQVQHSHCGSHQHTAISKGAQQKDCLEGSGQDRDRQWTSTKQSLLVGESDPHFCTSDLCAWGQGQAMLHNSSAHCVAMQNCQPTLDTNRNNVNIKDLQTQNKSTSGHGGMEHASSLNGSITTSVDGETQLSAINHACEPFATKEGSNALQFYGIKPIVTSMKEGKGKSLVVSGSADNGSKTPAQSKAHSVKGKCVAHSEDRFRVEVGYHAKLIEMFRGLSSRNYGKTN